MQITCPSCKKSLRVADTAAGKKVKCPACATAFVAVDQVEELIQESPPRAPKAPAKPVVDQVEEVEPPRPPRRRDEEDEDDDRRRPPRRRDDDDDDDDDDRPRRGRRRYEDEGIGRRRRSSGGSITSVGVITIILGSLTLLCGLCVTIASLGFAGAGMQGMRGQNFLPFQAAAGIMIVISIVILIFGALYLVGGIGVLQRRNWGRIVTLVAAGFSGVFGVLQLIGGIMNMVNPGPIPGESRALALIINLLVAAVFFTHCIMSFIVLLSGQNAREFE